MQFGKAIQYIFVSLMLLSCVGEKGNLEIKGSPARTNSPVNGSTTSGGTTTPGVVNILNFQVTTSTPTNSLTVNLSYSIDSNNYSKFCLLENSINVASCVWNNPPLPTNTVLSNLDGFKKFTLFLKDSSGAIASSAESNTIELDRVAPAVPSSPSTTPASPNSSLTPLLKGISSSDTNQLFFYSESTCILMIGYGNRTAFSSSGISLSVSPLATTNVYAIAQDLAGNSSSCTLVTSYQNIAAAGGGGATIPPVGISLELTSANPSKVNAIGIKLNASYQSADQYCILENSTIVGTCTWLPLPFPSTFNVSNGDGNKVLSVFLRDPTGNISNRVDGPVIILDKTAPASPSGISSSPGSPSNSTTPFIKGIVDTDTVGVYLYDAPGCAIPLGYGSDVSFSTSGIPVSVMSLSTTTLYVQSIDSAGNRSACPLGISYIHQNTAVSPLAIGYLNVSVPSPSSMLNPTIIGFAGADVVTVKTYSNPACTTEIGTGTKNIFETSGITSTLTVNSTTIIYAQGEDASLNKSACTLMTTYLHDSTAPLAPTALTVASLYTSITTTPNLSWTGGNVDAGSGFKEFQYSIGTSAGATDVLNWTVTSSTNNLQVGGLALLDGQTYFLNLRSIDKAGNISTVTSSNSWTIDISAPSANPTFISTAPTSPSNSSTSPLVSGTASADTFELKLYSDAGCTALVTSGTRAAFVGAGISFAVGTNSTTPVYARAFDAAGNYSPTCVYLSSYVHDNISPSLDILNIINPYYTNSTSFNLSWGAVYGTPSQYCIRENNTSEIGCVWNNFPLPTSYTVSGVNGSVVLSVFIRDAALNVSTRTDGPVKIFDNIAPSWAAPSIGYVTTSASTEVSPGVTYSRNGTEANPGLYYQYALGTGLVGATINNVVDWQTLVTSTFSISGLSLIDGSSYYIHLRAVDAAGNVTVGVPGNSFTINIVVPPPVFLAFTPTSPTAATSTPVIKGSSSGIAANVTFYSNSDCTVSIGSGTLANFSTAGVTLNVATNASTAVYARTANAGATKFSLCTFMNLFVHDSVAPVSISELNDGDYFSSLTASPSISWTGGGVDATSGFNRYEYAIGTSAGATDVVNWTSTGSATAVSATGLSLNDGNTYYASVRVLDNVGNISNVFQGDGWIVDTMVPSIAVIEPTENKEINTKRRDFFGSCDVGELIAISYGASSSGPSTVNCQSNGTYTVNVVFTGIEGNRSVTFTQTDNASNTTSTTRTIAYRPTFNQFTDGFNNIVWNVTRVLTGTRRGLFVGGDFTQYGDLTLGKIVKLFDDGFVDPTFATGAGFNSSVYTILPDTKVGNEGKVYVGGLFTDYDANAGNDAYLVRLNADGSLDTSFDAGVVNGAVNALAYAPDGSGDLYVGGAFTNYQGTVANRLVRITSNGARSVATTFNTNGSGANGPNGIVYSIVPAQDATTDIYIGGAFTIVGGTTINKIARLDNTGAHNVTFRTGVVTTNNGFNADVRTIVVDATDTTRLYVGGAFTTYKAVANNFIIRLKNDGTSDLANFATGVGFSAASIVYSISQIPGTSDIIAGGSFTTYKATPAARIVRLNSLGSIVPAFNYRLGFETSVYNIYIPPLVENPTLDIYASGAFLNYNSNGMPRLARINADGTLDNFLEVGAGVAGASAYAYNFMLAQDKSEKIYIGGSFTTYNGTSSAYIARVLRNGLYDTSFAVGTGFNAIVRTIIPRVNRTGLTAAQKDQIYVAGDFTTYKGAPVGTYNRIVRLNSDGSVDNTFNVGTGFNSVVYSMIPTNDGTGDLYVSGFFDTYKGVSSKKIIRLKENGDIEYSFNVGSGFNNYVLSMENAPDSTNDIYVGGYFTTYNGTTKNKIVRLEPNGSISNLFSVGTGFNAAVSKGVWTIKADPNSTGNIYLGGNFTSYQSITTWGITKLKPNGAIDSSFRTGEVLGYYTATPTYTPGTIYSIAPQANGSVLVGGLFNRYNGTGNAISPNIIRLTSDGTIDGSFVVGTGVNANVYNIIDAGDGSLDYIMGGDFTLYNGLSRNGMSRIQGNGNAN